MSCNHCGEDPCIIMIYCDEVIELGRQEAESCGEVGNGPCMHHSYRVMVCLWIGPTGRGNRIRLPDCVLEAI